MIRCIELAKNGLGTTYPNPLVGSVIVYNEKIIGEGWHQRAGLPHAEVNAIASVVDKNLLKEATIYVNLEPCNHYGKTPPCSNLIIKNEIKKVVIGCSDPNPKVAGKGIKKLKDAGCEVIENVLHNEAEELNKRFITFQTKNRPYIFLKWAESNDGFIAPLSKKDKKPVWISNKYSRQLAHKLRAEEQAILVGTNTVLEDNPSLTTRDWNGSSPIRVVLDRSLKIPADATIFDGKAKTIIITEQQKNNEAKVIYETVNFFKNLAANICEILYKHNIQSVIIEGGSKTLQTFIDEKLWDEAIVFRGSSSLNQGLEAPKLNGTLASERNIKNDLLFHYKNLNK